MADWENMLDDNADFEIKKEGEVFENEEIIVKKEQKPAPANNAPKELAEKKERKPAKAESKAVDTTPRELTEEEKARLEK